MNNKILVFISSIVIITTGLLCGCLNENNQSTIHSDSTIHNDKSFEGKTIVVLCGAGLMKPMNELIQNFENKTGAHVKVHYGGSAEIFGVLATTGGDIFIPGAYKYTEDAMNKGFILNNTVKNITYHIPVIAVSKGNPKNIKDLDDLAKPGIRVVVGDPNACAIGKVSKKILEKNHLWKNVSKNIIVKTPTVNQLLIYLATNQADASIIWEDMVVWSEGKGKIEVVKIPKNKNMIKTIPTAITVYAKKDNNLAVAKAFNDYISSDKAKEIWKKWNFVPCND
ncbi:molybdate ABC transporter substrate-binding protein [Methanothermococcus okinawensis]|uniref:Molybdenum ABC transporter, periplasmic molybdate-binding protein n=1 Tax=Methanothermococcus okinawensis (strain DSM 14208 / JCM 11175 / IH1) TaxID=647113 RepID=F8AJV5_METOI|nr:molybdate ABC transporter substrate-binding protein [Methanothermococcus okinawensis]AEH07307.1 molybdenum ABC transporter, periplasmic molybdate-binding protein [Methanothermococcus okinawensis IH1]